MDGRACRDQWEPRNHAARSVIDARAQHCRNRFIGESRSRLFFGLTAHEYTRAYDLCSEAECGTRVRRRDSRTDEHTADQ
jgi:hypothetical protein